MAPLALQVVINWRPGPSAFTLVTSNGYDLIHLSAPVVPLDLWVSPGCRWEAGETDSVLKLPAFSRCIERRQPPFRPAGIQRCSKQTLRLWRSFHFSYPPFTLALRYLLTGGKLVRPCSAQERKMLMGSLPEHTAAVRCHASMSKHVAEVVHCSLRRISLEASQVLKPDATRQPLEAMWTYCSWCGRRCSLREAATCGMAVHYPCLELHISNCMDCKRIIDHGEGLRTAKAAGPSFSYVNLLTLTFGLFRVLTLFFFRHLRFQGLQEKLLLAPSSAKIVHSASAPALEEDKCPSLSSV